MTTRAPIKDRLQRVTYLVRKSNQTRSLLTTGMFNLIVKDPSGDPPERAVLDRGPNPKIGVSSNLLRTEQIQRKRFSSFVLRLLDFTRLSLNRQALSLASRPAQGG